MATTVLGLKTFAASDPVDYNEVNDNYVKIDGGVKTAMQGRAVQNLLDNSWFVNPVNQRGKTSYTGVANASVYTIDRWLFSWQDGAVLTVCDGYIQHNGYKLQQYFEKSLDANKTYTAALCLTNGTIYVYSGKPSDGFGSWDNTIWVSSSYFRIEKGMTQPIKWAALYEGSYTADTLPAYVPKGYAAELAECQRYYYQSWDGNKFNKGYITREAISASSLALIEFPTEMRIVPTITFYTAANETGVVKEWTTSSSVSATQNYTSTKAFGVSGGSNFTIGKTYFFHYTASADL